VVTSGAQVRAATKRGKDFDAHEPRAVAAAYQPHRDVVTIKLSNDVEVAIPRNRLQGLEGARPADLSDIEIVGPGSGLHWKRLDVDHYVPALIRGIFGNPRWMSKIGQKGGAARTQAKATAARINGRKGGRPKQNV